MRYAWLLLTLAGCAATRAGHPSEVSPCARPSDDGGYVGYQVGGGAALGHGDGPTRDDGTWGWDYAGCRLPAWVTLGWWRGKPQGGTGAYNTDGPRPLERIAGRNE